MPDRAKQKQPDHHWPFNPMQPGDHEPARIPEDLFDPDEELAKRLEERRKDLRRGGADIP
jgi:hypothetical protein